MIRISLKNSFVEDSVEKYHRKVAILAKRMEENSAVGSDYLGWKDWPKNYNQTEFEEVKKVAKSLKKAGVTTLVVVGIGGSFAGSRAAIEMIQGQYPINADMEVIFIGESVSSTNLAQKLIYLEDKNFAINVISKSGTTLEPAIAFKLIKKLLEDKVGKYNAHKFIIATTDANRGVLLKTSIENEYKTFMIPDNIGGRFSVLTPVGIFPMACAGIDVDQVMQGALEGYKKYREIDLKVNDAYKYAVARHILGQKYPIELMVQFEPQMQGFSEWWKQLAGESEGKNEKGIFPASAIFSTDLHSLGQFIQDGSKVCFETMMFVKNPMLNLQMLSDERNLDNLNRFSSLNLHKINEVIFNATKDAHHKVGKVPIIEIILQDFSPKTFGQLVVFFERVVAMTAYLLDVNPFNQPGVEIYKQNMFKELENLIQ